MSSCLCVGESERERARARERARQRAREREGKKERERASAREEESRGASEAKRGAACLVRAASDGLTDHQRLPLRRPHHPHPRLRWLSLHPIMTLLSEQEDACRHPCAPCPEQRSACSGYSRAHVVAIRQRM
eukprot:1118447-Rhodomonas_salina.1